MSFSRRVELLLEKKRPVLSNFIFEEKDEKKEENKEEESSEEEGGGLFDMKDEEETAPKEEEEVETGAETSVQPEDESSEVTKQQIETLTSQIEAIRATIDKVNSDDGTQSIESFIAGVVAKEVSQDTDKESEGDVSESYYGNNSISSFLLTEDEDLEAVEKNIDVLDRVLTKGTDLVDKFKKGKEIDINSYVTAAINAYKNFDNLFAKEKIVKQATINVLVLNSGSKAEANIKEFEELFHEELHRQFGVEYPEYELVTKKHNTAVGAMKQG